MTNTTIFHLIGFHSTHLRGDYDDSIIFPCIKRGERLISRRYNEYHKTGQCYYYKHE